MPALPPLACLEDSFRVESRFVFHIIKRLCPPSIRCPQARIHQKKNTPGDDDDCHIATVPSRCIIAIAQKGRATGWGQSFWSTVKNCLKCDTVFFSCQISPWVLFWAIFECFFRSALFGALKKHSRYFGTFFLKTSISVPSEILVARMKALLSGISCNFLQKWIVGHSPESELLTFNMRHSNIVRLSHVSHLEQTVLNTL